MRITDKRACVIVGAGELEDAVIRRREGDLVIAADGGLKYLERAGIAPDIALGDFDSLGYRPDLPEVIYHPPEKDDTDTMLAVREGFARGFDTFVIYAGLGGRLDHTVANLQTLAFIAENGGRGYLVGGSAVSTAVKDASISFGAGERGMISVFCMGEKAEGVTISGLKYEVENAELVPYLPLGASNEFTGKPAKIEVKHVTLLVMWQQDNTR